MKLPSKLTTFEKFLFFDDYPAYPNTIACRLDLTGKLDVNALDSAANLVALRNPLLSTTLDTRSRNPAWKTFHPDPCVKRLANEYVDQPFLKKIDLEMEPGGQLHWAHCHERTRMNLLTHHASADGIGGLQVVADLLTAYSHYVAEYGVAANQSPVQASKNEDLDLRVASKMRRTDPDLLNRRGRYGFCSWRFIKSIPRQMIGLMGVKEFFVNHPVTLTSETRGPLETPVAGGYPGVHTAELGDVDEIRGKAGQEKVTANDLILQCIFLALAKWRRKHQFGCDRDLLRLMVPINLRTIADRYLPASHRSSMVTLDRVQEKCLDEDYLINSIRFQMNVIKSNGLGYTFLHMLNLFRWLPKGLRRFADPDRVGSTMVVTNLGEPFKRIKLPRNEQGKLIVGGQVLESIELVAPLRPNTQAAFAIMRYASKTFLSLTYDNRVITPELAAELTSLVCEEFHSKA